MAEVIETERLTLRTHRAEDLDEYAALWGDPQVVRYIGGQPSSRQQSWARLLRQAGHWRLLGFGFWVLQERATGRLVGEAGFANFERDIDPPLGDAPEAGWVLARWAQGVGYASEAMAAALAWGEERFRGEHAVCIIDPENAASLRLAAKLGFVETHRTTFMGDPTIVFRRPFSTATDTP